MKRVEIQIEDDQVNPYLELIAKLPKPLIALKIDPVRIRASRAKTPAPEGQQS